MRTRGATRSSKSPRLDSSYRRRIIRFTQRSLPVLACGLAAVLGAGAPANASPACSGAAARAAIAQAKPRLALIGDVVLITPSQAGQVLCFDATGDGRPDMAVTLASGGTAGDIGWLFFVAEAARWRLSGHATGYKLALIRSGRGLETIQPVYRSRDPNCCPTGGFDRTVRRWDGHRLVVARRWHTQTFR